MSGPDSLNIAKKLSKKENFIPRQAVLSNLYNELDEILDESIIIYFKAPYSFSGEDIVEFQCHGGYIVADMILNTILKSGARLANPGEFSKRAFLNGKIDLTKAEAIAKLIETKSEDGAKVLARQLKGELQDFVEKIRDDLVEILAFVEVNIDYAEEDLPLDLLKQIEIKLKNLYLLLKKIYDSSKRREGIIEGFKVAIVGKPNVGKSSLLNSLLNYERAIISDIAGTTRDTVEEEVRIGTHLIKIVDTAGIRESRDTIEKIGIKRSINAITSSDIVIAMFDNSRICDKEDQIILKTIDDFKEDKNIIIALNKIDLENKFDKSFLNSYVEISCKQNSEAIISKLKTILNKTNLDDSLLLTSKRQMIAIKNTYKEIKQAQGVLSEGELEIFAFHINEAIRHISKITKNFDRDEILDKMFGSFCLGK